MKEKLTGIVIDPSHGGSDFGASNNGISEKDIVLELSKYIQKRLEDLGLNTILTRNDDTTLSPNDRINKIKNSFGDKNGILVISNHLKNLGGNGIDIIYSINDNNLDLVNNLKRQLEYEGFESIKTYSQPLLGNNNLDANILQRNLENAKTIIINYGNLLENDNLEEIQNKIYNYGEGIVRGIVSNYGIAYEEPNDIKLNTHVVLKGESLYSIAQDYDVTIGSIKALNNLKSNILYIGQVLKIPNYANLSIPAKDITIYTVKKGDNLYNIAKSFNIDVLDIIEYNQLFNTVLTIGQQLIIPIEKKSNYSNNDISYIVQKGDSLYSIAKKYNTNVKDLLEYNNLNNNMIAIGEKLLIPNTKDYITYYARTNDTLEAIAKKFNTTVESLKRINNLNTDDITIGQLLIIN